MNAPVERSTQSIESTSPSPAPAATENAPDSATTPPRPMSDAANRRWWMKLTLQPLALLIAGAALIAGLGVAQRAGWITAGGGASAPTAAAGDEEVSYICPMMCTPPLSEPGRCPVCGMELVPSTIGGAKTDPHAVRIDPAARRVADIRTVAVTSLSATRTIRSIGELRYNEGTLKTISAYFDGRIEKLYADYTGVVVRKDDRLALIYSPALHSAQAEYLLAKKAHDERKAAASSRIGRFDIDLSESARQKLVELGMTVAQIEELERAGRAMSRLHLHAPNAGTVIEKLAVEGQYVKEGEPIYRLAELSDMWLMLRLFPDDAAAIRVGQEVDAEVQSLPGRRFSGQVEFIDPNVDPATRTVGVRVVMPNDEGSLRAGDFARATIEAPLSDQGLVHVVPRDAVLMAGRNSVLYAETEPGRFELRQVTLGPAMGDRIVVLSGVSKGEQVATRGNFLIDSQMQLAGNPSLIDPSKAMPKPDVDDNEKIMAALAGLSKEDRQAAVNQRICPVTKLALGSMGMPAKVEVDDESVFICCQDCETRLVDSPEKYLVNLSRRGAVDAADREISAALAKLSADDRALAERQRTCPVADLLLGSMGPPLKIDLDGTPLFICCEACRARLMKEPDKYRGKLNEGEAAADPRKTGLSPSYEGVAERREGSTR